MFYYNQYVRAQSLDEAYELYQKKPNFVLGGMLWLKMKNKTDVYKRQIMGACLVGGIFEGILGAFLKPLRKFFPAIVTRCV